MPVLDSSAVDALFGGGAGGVPAAATESAAAPREAVSFPELEGQGKGTRPFRRAGGIEDLPIISAGVMRAESGGNERAVGPMTRVGRAYGLYGVLESTAKDLGATGDEWKTDGQQSKQLGDKYLGQLYGKYGNWDDTLRAYNWGPGNVDKWIDKGRKPEAVPKETQAYVKNVMDHGSLDSPGRRMAEDRGRLNSADVADLFKGAGSAPIEQGAQFNEDDIDDVFMRPQIEGFAAGALRGAIDLPGGALRKGLEIASPKMAAKFQAQIEALDEHTGRAKDAAPWSYYAGEVVGQTVTVLGAGKLLAPAFSLGAQVPAIGRMVAQVPAKARAYLAGAAGGAAVGAAPGANKADDEVDKGLAAAVGAVFGTLGVGVARHLSWVARNVSDATIQSDFVQQLQGAVGQLGRNVGTVKDAVVQHMADLETRLASMVATRDAAGRVAQGFHAQGLRDFADLATEKAASEVKAVQKNVEQIMGVTQEQAARAAWDKEQAKFEKDMLAWRKQFSGLGPTAQRQAMAQAAKAGNPPPVAPSPYVAKRVAPEDFARGVQYLKEREARASVPTVKGGIVKLREAITNEAGAQARSIRSVDPKTGRAIPGKPTAEFYRAMNEANDFLKGEIEPIRRAFREKFGTTNPNEVSPAKFYDWVTSVVEHGDRQEIQGLKRMLGSSPRLAEAMQQTVLHKMLMAGTGTGLKAKFDPQKVADYALKHRAGLAEILPHNVMEELNGQVAIAKRIADLPKVVRHGGRIWGWSGWLGVVGLEHAFRGHVVEGAIMAGSGFFAHTMYNFLSRVKTVAPELSLTVRRIGKMQPGPGMDQEINKVMMRMGGQYSAVGRVTTQEMGQ